LIKKKVDIKRGFEVVSGARFVSHRIVPLVGLALSLFHFRREI
jgi:hypothetical protein